MNWYQAISLFVVLFFSWNLLPPLYALVHGKGFSIGLSERLFFTALFMNLALSFLGAPW